MQAEADRAYSFCALDLDMGPRLKIGKLKHPIVVVSALHVDLVFVLKFGHGFAERLMESLLIVESWSQPKNEVILLGIELPDVIRDNVTLVADGRFEGEFALNSDLEALRIDSQ